MTDRQTTDRQMKLRSNTHGCELIKYMFGTNGLNKSVKPIGYNKLPFVPRRRHKYHVVYYFFKVKSKTIGFIFITFFPCDIPKISPRWRKRRIL